MITKKIIAPLVVVIILSGIGGVLTAKKFTDNQTANTTQLTASDQTDVEPKETSAANQNTQPTANTPAAKPALLAGRYSSYNASQVSEQGYENTILFFYAAWCPECRAFKQAINSSNIPQGVQILEVNYDTASDLKKQHNVTLQTTFVKVNSQGDQVSKWAGYGKDKSLQSVLNNL